MITNPGVYVAMALAVAVVVIAVAGVVAANWIDGKIGGRR